MSSITPELDLDIEHGQDKTLVDASTPVPGYDKSGGSTLNQELQTLVQPTANAAVQRLDTDSGKPELI